MITEINNENPIYSKIRKLLALSDSARNSSEAEAQAAALKVQELLQDYGLSMAQIESSQPETGPEKRENKIVERRAMYTWQQDLMAQLAKNNFCLHRIRTQRVEEYGKWYNSKRHQLVGRPLNVQVTLDTYDYLIEAMRRAAKDAGFDRSERSKARENTIFMEGATVRLTERLDEMRVQREEESRKAEEARRAAGGTGNALILSDVYGTEADLNNDALCNFPLGTTAQKRRDREAKEAARVAKEKELIAQGVEAIEAFYLSHGYEANRAKELAADYNKRRATSARRSSGGTYRAYRYSEADYAHARKINSSAYKAGKSAGGSISLNTQVGASARPALK